jgi:phosphocarrier protein HPr
MVEKLTVILNRAGIHARPAALIVQTAGKFKSKITLRKGEDSINGKSIMGIITLGAGYETEIRIIAEGEDEAEAVEAIDRLFRNRFEEE